MPLSKKRQAQWMRNYRANKREIGITAMKTRGIGESVIPRLTTDDSVPCFDRAGISVMDIPELDADGNLIYDE